MFDFFKTYILLNTKDYISEGIDLYLGPVVTAFALGICIALFVGHFRRAAEYQLLKALLKRQAVGESCAATLADLGPSHSRPVIRLLRSPGKIATLVSVAQSVPASPDKSDAEEEKPLPPAPSDPRADAYFLTEETRKQAKSLVANGKPSVFRPILLSVVSLGVGCGFLLLLPAILSLFA